MSGGGRRPGQHPGETSVLSKMHTPGSDLGEILEDLFISVISSQILAPK